MSRQPLTDRQKECMRFIRSYFFANGWAPSCREIGNAMGIASMNGVVTHLVILERKGWIKRGPDARQISVVGWDREARRLRRRVAELEAEVIRLKGAVA